jgi:hypothetical protein
MNWVVARGHAATRYYRLGWARALAASGHVVNEWDCERVPPNDLYANGPVDGLLVGVWELTPSLVRNANKAGTTVFLWGNNWGPFKCDPEDTVEFATDQHKKMAEELVWDGTGRVFHYYHPNRIEGTMSGWREAGLEPVGIPLAADILAFPLTRPDPNMASDVAFIGARWDYKAKELDSHLLPMCHPDSNLSVKIFGGGHWPVPQALGHVDDRMAPTVLASAKVCPCIYEPLSVKYGFDVSERPYKVLSVGSLAVSQYVASAAEDVFPNGEVVFTRTPREFHEAVQHYVQSPDKREEVVRRGLFSAYANHTYFDRLRDAWRELGMSGQVDATMNAKLKVVRSIADRARAWAPEKADLILQAAGATA